MLVYPPSCFKISLAFIIIVWVQRFATFEIYLTDPETLNGYCERNRLLSYGYILTYDGQDQAMKLLQDGDSARIAGVARFSRRVSFYGCFNVSSWYATGTYMYKLSSETKLFHCIFNCSSHQVPMIGVSNEYCYCFSDDTLPNDRQLEKSSCDQTHTALFDNKFQDFERSKLVVYTFKSKRVQIETFFPAKHSFKQCQFVMKTLNSSTTGSPLTFTEQTCSTKGNVKGFICKINPSHKQCNKTNEHLIKPENDNEVFCLVKQPLTLTEAETYCSSKIGTLSPKTMSIYAGKALAEHLENNAAYLLNNFREVSIDERTQSHSKEDQCISVRKSEEILLVETVNCGIDLPSLCYRALNMTKENDTDTVDPVSSPEFSEGNPIRTIIIVVSLGCVVLVAIIAVLVIKYVFKGSESKGQPSADACKSGTTYGDPLSQGNGITEHVSNKPKVPGNIENHNKDINELHVPGTEAKYEDIEGNEDITSYSSEGGNQHTSGMEKYYDHVERNYHVLGNTNKNCSNHTGYHIYNTTSENELHYDRLGQHDKSSKRCGRVSNIYNHVSSEDGD